MAPVNWHIKREHDVKVIKSGQSRPIDSNKKSFCTLPHELRNMIYALAFEFPDPLKFATSIVDDERDIHLYHQKGDGNEPLFGGNGALHSTSQSHLPGEHIYDYGTYKSNAEIDKDTTTLMEGYFIRAHIPALVLLRTCRQVYHEAASSFYLNNTFIATHTDRFEITAQSQSFNVIGPFHDREGLCFAAWAGWKMSLGSQIRLTNPRNTIIDTDTICPPTCAAYSHLEGVFEDTLGVRSTQMLNATPLLLTCWASCVPYDTPCLRKLLPSQPRLHLGVAPGSGIASAIVIDTLNNTIKRIVADELDIKQYKLLLGMVGIDRSGRTGAVMYRATNTHGLCTYPMLDGRPERNCSGCTFCHSEDDRSARYHSCPSTYRAFHRDHTGALQWDTEDGCSQPHLLKLPPLIEKRIFRELFYPRGTVVFDVNEHCSIRTVAALMLTSIPLKKIVEPIIWQGNTVELVHSSTHRDEYVSDFDSLRKWIYGSVQGSTHDHRYVSGWDSLPRGIFGPGIETYTHPTQVSKRLNETDVQIKLVCRFSRRISLQEMRINISNFIFATAHIHNHYEHRHRFVIIEVHVGNTVLLQRFQLQYIRHKALDALNEIMPFMKYAARFRIYPGIWMDGLGEVYLKWTETSMGPLVPRARSPSLPLCHTLLNMKNYLEQIVDGKTDASLAAHLAMFGPRRCPVPLAGPWFGTLVFASDPAARVRISSLLSEAVSQALSAQRRCLCPTCCNMQERC